MTIERDMTAAAEAATEAGAVRWGFSFVGEFDGGTVYLWSGIGSLTIDGNEYIGAGGLIGFGGVSENFDLGATSASVTLSGIPSEYISLALAEDYQGRPASVSLILFDANNAVIADPIQIFSGKIDTMSISDDGEESTIDVIAETDIALFSVTKPRWMTQASQQALYPDDRGFAFVAALQSREVVWGG